MTKIQKIKMSLQRMLMNFGDVTTDKGVLEYAGEELTEGTQVFIEDVPAPDGEYETETQIIVVAEGKVVEIREKEVAPEVPVVPENEVTEAEEEPSLEDSLVEILKPITDELNAVKAELEAVKARLAEIESKLLEDSAKPAEEEFKTVNKNSGFWPSYNRK